LTDFFGIVINKKKKWVNALNYIRKGRIL